MNDERETQMTGLNPENARERCMRVFPDVEEERVKCTQKKVH